MATGYILLQSAPFSKQSGIMGLSPFLYGMKYLKLHYTADGTGPGLIARFFSINISREVVLMPGFCRKSGMPLKMTTAG